MNRRTFVFDHESVFVGRFNLDPRSATINTEMGLNVENPELASQLVADMDDGVRPRNAYRVMLDENEEIVWRTEKDGNLLQLKVETHN